MDNKIDFIKNKVKKHSKKFSLFVFIGVLKSILLIALNWLIIDILHVPTLIGSTAVVVSIFLLIYFVYVRTKVIRPALLKYTYVTISFNIAIILLIWFFVDFIGFSAAFSSVIAIGIQFVLRYLLLNKIGLIQHE